MGSGAIYLCSEKIGRLQHNNLAWQATAMGHSLNLSWLVKIFGKEADLLEYFRYHCVEYTVIRHITNEKLLFDCYFCRSFCTLKCNKIFTFFSQSLNNTLGSLSVKHHVVSYSQCIASLSPTTTRGIASVSCDSEQDISTTSNSGHFIMSAVSDWASVSVQAFSWLGRSDFMMVMRRAVNVCRIWEWHRVAVD